MGLEWADKDFEMRSGYWKPPSTCLSVQPHVVDFPARCARAYEHEGEHSSSPGYAGGHPVEITYWTDDE